MAKEVSVRTFLVLSILFVLISVSATVLFLTEWQKELTSITGAVSGVAQVEVICLVAISLPVNSVNFGAVPQGYVDDTSDDNPMPMVVQNDGGIRVDVTIARDASSSPMFNGTGGGDNSSSFQFKIDNTNETNSFNYSASLTNWTNVPGTSPLTAIYGLKYSDEHDSAEVDLLIDVPNNEPIGKKNETLNFIAAPSEGAICGDEAEEGSCKDRFWECLDDYSDHDSDGYLSCGHAYSHCIREGCISELQECKDNCTSADCRRNCNNDFKECARG
ncbi:hypothetical protein GOV06_05290 [Candidatus Woesearchaeota archaeon]|nr:hypothetical protein [Candidatus Woesearchaeota archaeon]